MNLSPDHLLRPLFELAAREPERPIFTWVDETGADTETRTAGRLARDAVSMARYLREDCGLRAGEAVLLVYPPSLAFVEAFVGCLLAGIVPTPAYPPDPLRRTDMERVHAMVARARIGAILTTRTYRGLSLVGSVRGFLSRTGIGWPDVRWFVTDGVGERPGDTFDPPPRGRDDVAFLQFTSGSTATPKGVRLTHGNLAHQIRFNAERLGAGPDTRAVMWVPPYHDLGLVSNLVSALLGSGSFRILSPQTFLATPALWFETLHRIRGTHTSSPNFGFEHAIRKTTPEQRARWDLSSLRVVMSAGEPVLPETVDRFFDTFAPTGLRRDAFCPAYGLAEHTVGVTVWGRGRLRVDRGILAARGIASPSPGGDLELVGCGTPSHGIDVRILDPDTRTGRSDRVVGEICVRSPSVAGGYEGDPVATEQTFVEVPGEHGRWLRTGDLGFVHRGELFVTGRAKDLVIVRGRNLHPEDIEPVAQGAHPAIRPGGVVAFGAPREGTEGIGILVELRDAKPADGVAAEVAEAVRAAVGRAFGHAPTVGVVGPKTLAKTTSGKIRRAACRAAWLDGALAPLHTAVPAHADAPVDAGEGALRRQLDDLSADLRFSWLVEQLVARVRAHLGPAGAPVDARTSVFEAGMDSITAAALARQLEIGVGVPLPTSLLAEAPTPAGLAVRVLRLLDLPFEGGPDPGERPPVPMPWRPPRRAMAPGATRVAIVGGGVAGLVSALELARAGFSRIVVYESGADCGGKVHTVAVDGGRVELGQMYVRDSFRTVVEIAVSLGLSFEIMPADVQRWDDTYGLEHAPASGPGLQWMRRVLRAARQPLDAEVPSPATMDDLDEPFAAFLARHKLLPVHPEFEHAWQLLGYGVDMQVPTSYVVTYLQVYAAGGVAAFVSAGNQEIWRRLARRLEEAWGVEVRRSTTVEAVRPGEDGVVLHVDGAVERFDEVILATPPSVVGRLLPRDHALQPLLDRFWTYGFHSSAARADLAGPGTVWMTGSRVASGRLLGFMRAQGDGWFVGGGNTASPMDGEFAPEGIRRELEDLLRTVGATRVERGPGRTWEYFPHVRRDAAGTLRAVEALQGAGHLWMVGSWLTFESTETVARHARHLVRTCFDPAFA